MPIAMRWLKYTFLLLAGLAVAAFLALAVVWATFDDEDYRRLAVRGVEAFTGYAMTVDGAFSLTLSARPRLSAEGIRIEARDGDPPPPLKEIGKVNVQLDLPQLVFGRLVVPELMAEDVVLAIAVNNPADGEDDEGPLLAGDVDLPVFESVRLRNIHLDVTDVANARTIPVHMQWFDMDDVQNAGPMFVSGEGTVAGERFRLDGRMGALAEMLKEEAPYGVDYNLTVGGMHFSVAGTFADYLDAEGAELRITGEAAETADLFGLLSIETPPLGRLQFEAAVSGDLDAPRIPYLQLSLSGDPKIQFAVNGALADALTGEGAALDFAGSCTLPEILAMIRTEKLTGLTLLRLSGRLLEGGGALAVEDLALEAVSEEGAAVNAAGRITLGGHFGALGLGRVNLDLKALYPSSRVLRPIVFDRLPEVGPVFARGRLTGPPDALRLEDLTIDAGGQGPLRFTTKGLVTGKMDGYRLSASDIDLVTTTRSDTTAILAEAYGEELPELGMVSARYRLRGNLERFRLEELELRTATGQGLETACSGRIEFDRTRDPDLRGTLNLQLTATAPTLGAATAPWDIAYLPGLRDMKVKARIAGTTEAARLQDIDLQVGGRSQLQVRLTGDLDSIDPARDPVLAGIDLTATAAAASTADIFSGQGIRLPELGPLQVNAQIRDRDGAIDVETFTITGGTADDTVFTARGQLIGLNDLKRLRVTAGFETASKPWVAAYLDRDAVGNAAITGEIVAAGREDGIIIEKLYLLTLDAAPLRLAAQGSIQDLSGTARIDMQVDAGAADPAAIGPLTGLAVPQLAPVTLKGRMAGDVPNLAFEGEVLVGDTAFASRLRTTVGAGRPHISGEIRAGTVDLNEMGLIPGVPPEEALAASQPTAPSGKALFDKEPLLPFAALRAADVTLQLDIDKLVGRNIAIEQLDVEVHLENGRLRIQPAHMAYATGATDMSFSVDASGAVPTFALTFSGEDMDVDDLLAYAREPIVLSGSLNVAADLQSRGVSTHEIAANLTGTISLALENGRIWRVIDLFSKDVFDMLLTAADTRTYTDMHCLLSHVSFEKGTGTVDMLYMDSPKIRAKGAGTFHLADETMDMVVNPEHKGRLFRKRSAVRIKGAMTNPSVSSMPLAEAAELYGTIMLPVVFLPLRGMEYLVSMLTGDAEPTPCVMESSESQ
jgi:uncharacterized protein involved in outer membrane biogenesis